tara:strand:- start:1210 stop:2298 length:1089 start_codon:yes stop_codon:yes gene_type:complete
MIFNLITPIWGKYNIELFFKVTFKSIFFNGNINELKKYNTTITFCTFKKDIERIHKHLKNFNITNLIVKFVELDNLSKRSNVKRFYHYSVLKGILSEKRNHTKVNFIFQTSDDVHSEKNFENIIKILKKKKNVRCILENKIIVDENKFLKKFNLMNKYGISKNEMVKTGIQSMSIFTKSSTYGSKNFNYNAHSILWKVKKNVYICRGYLLHTFLIRPSKQITAMKSFHDYFLVPEYIKNFNQIYIPPRSSIFFRVGIENKKIKKLPFSYNANKFARSLKNWTTLHHRKYVFFPTVFEIKKKSTNINSVLKNSLNEVKKINFFLKQYKPKSHKNHPYWNINVKLNIFRKSERIIKKLLFSIFY